MLANHRDLILPLISWSVGPGPPSGGGLPPIPHSGDYFMPVGEFSRGIEPIGYNLCIFGIYWGIACVILGKGKSCNRLSVVGGPGILTMCPNQN